MSAKTKADVGHADPRLRVLVCAASARIGGGERFVTSQLEALAARGEFSITVYADGRLARRLEDRGTSVSVRRPPVRWVPARVAWEQLVLPIHIRHYDVLYMPGNFAVLASPVGQVVTLHNASHFGGTARRFRRESRSLAYRARLGLEAFLARASVRRATFAIAVSESLGAEIQGELGRLDHLIVVQSAASCGPLGGQAGEPEPRVRGVVAREYVLTVAHDYPHKDWDGLVRTFVRHQDLPQLIVVGAPRSKRRLEKLSRLASGGDTPRVHFRGALIDSAVLSTLYRDASCYIAHSHLESFGFTPCEAICHGTRLAASDIPAHRELCGQQAVYYDPLSDDSLASAVRLSLTRRRPSHKSLPVFKQTWEANAQHLARLLRSAGTAGPEVLTGKRH